MADLHLDPSGKERLGDLAPAVEDTIAALASRDTVARIWGGDFTLWQDEPTEITDRLGWLTVPHELFGRHAELEAFAAACHDDGLRHAVVLGMGGSSLFPEVITRTFGARPDRLALHVLDTTDPAAIRRVDDALPAAETLYVVASKSGSTVETLSHLAHFWERSGGAGDHFVAITDPGTSLATLARERGFRAVFENRADIGGRYSALSYFGLVPAALAGADVVGLLESALAMAGVLRDDADPYTHPGLRLGAVLGAGARAGLDKLTFVIDPEAASFGAWLEQLIAESTGKQGMGVVPVVGEDLGDPVEAEVYGRDRLFAAIGWNPALDALAGAGHPVVELPYEGPASLGAHVMLWEFATAVCGAVLGINPFDQPNVAEAKAATAKVLEAAQPPQLAVAPLAAVLDLVRPGDYVAIQAFVDPGSPVVEQLESARTVIRDRLLVATTLGIGPRYLHSTGQLHKGGPPSGVFVQVVGDDPIDVAIPGAPYSFSTLKRAQAAGDLDTLRAHGLRAARVPITDLLELNP